FGLSFFIQMDRGTAKGDNFRARFAWRLILLFVIGFGHHLLYRGDILTIYAMVGLPLILFYKVPNRWLWVSIIFLIFGPRFLVLAIKLSQGWDLQAMTEYADKGNETYYDIIKNGSLWAVMGINATFGFYTKMGFQWDVFARGYQTLALFLAGFWLGRKGWFHEAEAHKKTWKRVMWGGLAVTILALGGAAVFMTGSRDINNWPSMVGLGLYDLSNWGMTAFLVGAFVLLYLRPGSRKRLSKLAPYGRTALTNYILQSVIGVSIFFGFGLGLIGEIGATVALGIAILISILQIWLSRVWLQHYYYGPLEWLWRCATYMKWQRFRRETPKQKEELLGS
ncbi:MAG: DUF418 domain-containing protein, partial [Bacteroidota bacterium]